MRSISEVTSKDGGHQRDLTAFIYRMKTRDGNHHHQPVITIFNR
jgi:hypothetical protein